MKVVAGISGESEEKIRSVFTDARAAAPALLFIDEIDAIAPKREESAFSGGVEERTVHLFVS